ncbi:MAG TPA: NAD(P)H-hydrate dehydratase [Acidimicrobiales bacterium]|jgi:NAD(P)H-hydrate epimerase|nr:NAD(P)H-hydrate dehydratase [Acidimicrobiales bacterium]
MRDADARAGVARGVDALVDFAGTSVALLAQRLLRSCYAKRVAVVAGPGLNGADGRVAASWLASRGARVDLVEWDHLPDQLQGYDLVIDAAFGLGCTRPFIAPRVSTETLVLAVDLPSGVDADTGEVLGEPMVASATLALGALKPAHLTGPSAHFMGELHFAGLGIVSRFDDGLVEDGDLAGLISEHHDDHKWTHAVQALVGSPLMPGAAELVLRGALAGGASMIRLESRGDVAAYVQLPPEVVHTRETVVDPRARAVIAGPGLGPEAATWLRERLEGVNCPVVLDADGLDRTLIDELSPRDGSWILTPHEGEFARLTGRPLGPNRFDEVRELAHATGCTVLLKGPVTVIASPTGAIRVVNSGTPTLATAGTGDVLAGLIAATVARGHHPLEAAALAAHLHGRAGARLDAYATASDVAAKVAELLHDLGRARR